MAGVIRLAAVIDSISLGPGSVGSKLESRTQFGYSLERLVLLSTFWGVTGLYLVGEVTCVTGMSSMEVFEKYFHRYIACFKGAIMVLAYPISNISI